MIYLRVLPRIQIHTRMNQARERIPENQVSASAPGLSPASGKGKYNLKPQSGTEVTITATGKMSDGKVATDGWSKVTKHDVVDLAKKFEDYGCESIIYTDIGRDGMLTGVNIESTVRLAQHVRIPGIASGGVTDMRDIEALCAVEAEGIEGAILGRSIYEGTLDFEAAQLRADELAP